MQQYDTVSFRTMIEETLAEPAATIAVPVQEVRPGDALVLEREDLVVAGEPVTMHAGLGLFDELALFVGVPVRAGSGRAVLRRFAPGELVRVRRRW